MNEWLRRLGEPEAHFVKFGCWGWYQQTLHSHAQISKRATSERCYVRMKVYLTLLLKGMYVKIHKRSRWRVMDSPLYTRRISILESDDWKSFLSYLVITSYGLQRWGESIRVHSKVDPLDHDGPTQGSSRPICKTKFFFCGGRNLNTLQ